MNTKKVTLTAKPADVAAERVWYIVDATNRPLGRLAVDVARILRGKNKPNFSPNIDTGDYVIVINADKVVLTGHSKQREQVHHHTGWPGALKSIERSKELEKKPEEAVRRVVRAMVPSNKLGDAIIGKLKVHRGELPAHGYTAQNPVVWTGVENKGE
jgi:large subunit ribosomal protein L13